MAPWGGPLHRPLPLTISGGGPWPRLLPFHLNLFFHGVLLPYLLPFLSAPRRDRDHLSNLRYPKEGQDSFCRSLVPATSLEIVWREIVHLITQIVSRGRMPRQELAVEFYESLALVVELLLEFLAFRRAAAPPAVNMVRYPLAYPRRPRLGDPPGHACKVGFAEVRLLDGVPQVFRRPLGPVISNLVPLDAEVNWRPIVTSGCPPGSSGGYKPRWCLPRTSAPDPSHQIWRLVVVAGCVCCVDYIRLLR